MWLITHDPNYRMNSVVVYHAVGHCHVDVTNVCSCVTVETVLQPAHSSVQKKGLLVGTSAACPAMILHVLKLHVNRWFELRVSVDCVSAIDPALIWLENIRASLWQTWPAKWLKCKKDIRWIFQILLVDNESKAL